jgi:hypothetical protein
MKQAVTLNAGGGGWTSALYAEILSSLDQSSNEVDAAAWIKQ